MSFSFCKLVPLLGLSVILTVLVLSWCFVCDPLSLTRCLLVHGRVSLHLVPGGLSTRPPYSSIVNIVFHPVMSAL
jgi:hypothetical protein